MKTKLRLLSGLLLILGFFFSTRSYSQISYLETFEEEEIPWNNPDDFFGVDNYIPCNGYYAYAILSNFFGEPGANGSLISESIGTSNGSPALLSFSYKIVDLFTDEAMPNNPAWGSFSVQYSSSASGPWTTIVTVNPANHTESLDCAVKTATFTPPNGAVYLRINAVNPEESDDFLVAVAELDDITVIQQACSGTPSVYATMSTNNTPCTNELFTLSLAGNYLTTGISYQWQSSTNGTTYTNVPTGGTSSTYTTTQSAATWYRAVVTCSGSGLSSNSLALQVNSTGNLCYCDVEFFESDVEPITRVNFAGINNASSADTETNGMEDFTALAPAQVVKGQTYPVILEGNTVGEFDNYFTVYIDFNHNGNLDDAGESFEIGMISDSDGTDGQQATGTILIPTTAMTGITRMRVFKSYDLVNTDPCSADEGEGYGQVEDYRINITDPVVACSTAPENTDIMATVTDICGSDQALLSLNADYPEEITYQWQSSPNGTDFTDIDGATDATYTTEQEETTYYRVIITCPAASLSTTTGAIEITTTIVDAPTVEPAQSFCNSATVADLTAEEEGILWYATQTGGEILDDATALVTGTVYYAAISNGGCESARVAVTATINVTAQPTVQAAQSFCNAATVEDLTATETDVLWYAAATGGTALADDIALVSGTVYYAGRTANDCESTRVSVTVTITTTPPPTGEATQTLTQANDQEFFTVEDIEVEATGDVTWYVTMEDAIAGENPIDEEDPIDNGTYYAVNTANGCSSTPFAVTVDIVLGVTDFDAKTFSYYPNPVLGVLNIGYSKNITGVEVYNLVGQKVLTQSANSTNVQVNLQALAAGSYLVKVTTDAAATTFKVLKN